MHKTIARNIRIPAMMPNAIRIYGTTTQTPANTFEYITHGHG